MPSLSPLGTEVREEVGEDLEEGLQDSEVGVGGGWGRSGPSFSRRSRSWAHTIRACTPCVCVLALQGV